MYKLRIIGSRNLETNPLECFLKFHIYCTCNNILVQGGIGFRGKGVGTRSSCLTDHEFMNMI